LSGGDDYFGPDYGSATVYTNVRDGYTEECPNVGRLLDNLEFTLAMENEIIRRTDTTGVAGCEGALGHQVVVCVLPALNARATVFVYLGILLAVAAVAIYSGRHVLFQPWSARISMSLAVSQQSSGPVIYAVGGRRAGETLLEDILRFSPEEGTLDEWARLEGASAGCAAVGGAHPQFERQIGLWRIELGGGKAAVTALRLRSAPWN
jgi:hypothetical protein